jgi:hypothetical protein
MGDWLCLPYYEISAKKPKKVDVRLPPVSRSLEAAGALPQLQADVVPSIVGAYGGRLVIVTKLRLEDE